MNSEKKFTFDGLEYSIVSGHYTPPKSSRNSDRFVSNLESYFYFQKFLKEKIFVLDFQFYPDNVVERGGGHGLGDVLMYSSIPEAIKKDSKKLFTKVYIRNHFQTKYGYDESLIKSIFKDNPYIDGFIDYPYTGILNRFHSSVDSLLKTNIYTNEGNHRNLQDFFLDYIGILPLDLKYSYKPKIYNKSISKMNHLSNSICIDLNAVTSNKYYNINDVMMWIKNNKIDINFELTLKDKLKNRFTKTTIKPYYSQYYFTNYLEYFNVVSSVKEIYTLFSGSSLISTALGVKTNCFYPKSYDTFDHKNKTFQERYKVIDKNTNYIKI